MVVPTDATQSPAQDADDVSASYKRWALVRAYGFSLAGLNYLITPGTYSELIKNPSWSALPNVGQHFAGLINLRGNLVPVYHLDTFLSAVAPPLQAEFALLIGPAGQGAAVVLHEKPQAFDFASLTSSNDYALAPRAIAHCIKHTYRHNGEVWFELSQDALFSTLAG
jgi:twitching motility protein PilI